MQFKRGASRFYPLAPARGLPQPEHQPKFPKPDVILLDELKELLLTPEPDIKLSRKDKKDFQSPTTRLKKVNFHNFSFHLFAKVVCEQRCFCPKSNFKATVLN